MCVRVSVYFDRASYISYLSVVNIPWLEKQTKRMLNLTIFLFTYVNYYRFLNKNKRHKFDSFETTKMLNIGASTCFLGGLKIMVP